MHDQPSRIPGAVPDGGRPARRPWTEPMITRRESLPRITNGVAGSFDPGGGGKSGNAPGPARDKGSWGPEP